jgi:thymidylate synthase ThyX
MESFIGVRLRYHNRFVPDKTPRVIAVAPMPPEKSAYALARYSRSPDSIHDSVAWVRTHDSTKFLESFYFQYGHASIADLGHVALCFEGVSELAATEIEDEQLWDGQARSSRYQDFSKSGFVTPPGLAAEQSQLYSTAAQSLLDAYHQIHTRASEFLSEKLPRPEDMKPDAYQRNIAARAFDVARYTLFFGIPTGVGQVTSIRTLERQIRRLKASEYPEVRDLADEIAQACALPPTCVFDPTQPAEPLAPTLARHTDPDQHLIQSRRDLEQWAQQNLPESFASTQSSASPTPVPSSTPPHGTATVRERTDALVDLLAPTHAESEIVATLLYPVTTRPFRELYDLAQSWSPARRKEVIDIALRSRTDRDELPRAFRGAPYAFDIVMDIGAYRDLHRHRRCQQFRQAYSGDLGYDTPAAITESGLSNLYASTMQQIWNVRPQLPPAASHYLLPFAARSRFLFKMDFAEAEYIARLRSGVKGHFSYRQVAWEMKQKMEALEPSLGRLMEATPPWVEDPLKR